MQETELIKKAREYSESVLSKLPAHFYYHNLQHTREVVNASIEIGKHSELGKDELELVVLAAWFHDTGYECSVDHHEEESVKIMKMKMGEWGAPPEMTYQIGQVILSTHMPQSPQNLVSRVLCDADLHHLASDEFEEKSEALRKEIVVTCPDKIKDKNWNEMTLDFVSQHKYFTNYGQTILEPRKKKNVKKLKKSSKKKGGDNKYIEKLEAEVIKLKNKIERDKIRTPDKGIETMFRITSKNHLTLSGMADNKANIMISINSIILSVLVSVLFRKFEEYPSLIIPALLLVAVCLTTIVFAVLATRPNVSSGKFTREDIMNRKTNLLFFGNFHSMELDNYMWGMKEMMKDADYLYGSLTKDIFFLGIVLGKKYKMLRKSYNVFMFGFVISILAFIIAIFFFPSQG